jgi:hypothetical protein
MFMVDNPLTVPPEKGEGENVEQGNTSQELLAKLNEKAGRNYDSLEEALDGVGETYAFVGKLGEVKTKAKKYDEMQKAPPRKEDEYYHKVDKIEFLHQHPEATSVADIVGTLAKTKNVSWEEAYEETQEGKNLQRFVKMDADAQAAKEPAMVESGIRLSGGKGPISKKEFSNLPLEEQKKIVSKLGMWGEKFPLGHFSTSKKSG